MRLLPIHEVIDELRSTLSRHASVVLEAPPGAGKTTVVPVELLAEPWLRGKKILMLEPRRLAARRAATYMAGKLGEEVGKTVGYQVRRERRIGAHTRIEVLTEGILTRRLQSDPELSGVGLVIFDEFHERNLQSDLAMALCLQVRQMLRDDLKILVMSATLDGQAVAELLRDEQALTPVLRSEGKRYPVTTHYAKNPLSRRIEGDVQRIVRRALRETKGNILVFLPGQGEIKRLESALGEDASCRSVQIRPLYGALPKEVQDRAVRFDQRDPRAVILSTPIAESSITIEGVRVVVDSGLRRRPTFDAGRGMSRLKTVQISKASADQRRGRAGRLGPGICYRLWTEQEQRGLRASIQAEILTSDLAPLALELFAWGVNDPGELRWLDAPPESAWMRAVALLRELGAIDRNGRLSEAGKQMARLPMHPRTSHMLTAAAKHDLSAAACDVAAVLEERDLLAGEQRNSRDLGMRLEALDAYRHRERYPGMVKGACAAVDESARRWRKILDIKGGWPDSATTLYNLGPLLSMAYPDRVAQGRANDAGRYVLANGRGVRLPEGDLMQQHSYLAVAGMDAGQTEGWIHTAAPVSEEELREFLPHLLVFDERVVWDSKTKAVRAQREERLGRLVLSRERLKEPNADALVAAMLEGICQLGIEALPWSKESSRLRSRMRFMAITFGEEGWPDVSDEGMLANRQKWLGPWLSGITRAEQLRRLNMKEILRSLLDFKQGKRLEEGAPSHMPLPSGSRAPLDYEPGKAPVLAARVQQMFGYADTPTVAFGRVPVTIHLLSPASRPVQVTQDLKSFWERTYPQVKKELKGRYPKHPWPDDPWNAVATDRVKRRR